MERDQRITNLRGEKAEILNTLPPLLNAKLEEIHRIQSLLVEEVIQIEHEIEQSKVRQTEIEAILNEL